MGNYGYKLAFAFLGSVMLLSCGKDEAIEDGEPINGENGIVCFEAQLGAMSRATDTFFDVNDEIGVFAVVANETDNKGVISNQGNYADNVKYYYDGEKFTSDNGIAIDKENKYFYHAVYPYTSVAANSFNFVVKNDQRGDNYTLSDLCTAHSIATLSPLVQLNFRHRLSKVVVNLSGSNWPTGDRMLTLESPLVGTMADLNALTFVATTTKGDVVCSDNGTNSFKAILPPQTISKDNFATLTIGENNYTVTLAEDLVLKSGIQKEITLTYNNNEVIVEFTGDIAPWGDDTVDNRFENIVPLEIRSALEEHMAIYDGVNPPNIEGSYFIDPLDLVYSTDGYDSDNWASYYLKFSNQNVTDNTIDYDEISTTGDVASSDGGAYISGYDNYFTTFFNTEGMSHEIYIRTALVISGCKTDEGLRDVRYAFILVEKGEDPEGVLMDEGAFRVFKDLDELAENITWPNISGLKMNKSMFSIFCKNK